MLRASGSRSYIYLIPFALGGFAMCLVAIYLAMRGRGRQAEEWRGKVERATGRDLLICWSFSR